VSLITNILQENKNSICRRREPKTSDLSGTPADQSGGSTSNTTNPAWGPSKCSQSSLWGPCPMFLGKAYLQSSKGKATIKLKQDVWDQGSKQCLRELSNQSGDSLLQDVRSSARKHWQEIYWDNRTAGDIKFHGHQFLVDSEPQRSYEKVRSPGVGLPDIRMSATLSMVVCVLIPSYSGGWGRKIAGARSLRPVWGT
jgi:hypothetical protein